ncbi:cytosine deaminase [Propionibacterium cyclohexanicum]|uniref:Cytosine deaminase n=1 Tax=Propionibacterium cyclohexanicum TaxID=64702 RepID=A0A1H9TKP4_9ACTN|nr:amidohydrolase family protein [Propionibacterium cyclohexanicum]SER97698.1 cytosine deaminase [Propionibacterium cyclohexanicum]
MAELVLADVNIGKSTSRNVLIREGTIASIAATLGALHAQPGATLIECGHRALVPGFVEPHMHLDKALLDARMPNLEGTLEGAIAVTGALKGQFTLEDVTERARLVLDMAIAHGTTFIRCHPDVDPIEKLIGVEALLALREEYRGRVDLQIVAFPQEGILKAPGTYELMDQAMAAGAEVVGGCTYNEPTLEGCLRHIDMVFDLAAKYDAPVDMHCDFQVDTSDPRYALVEHIADVTIARGWEGRVTLGHVTSLASLSGKHRIEVWDRIKQAGINIVPLPFTDMHLNARGDDHNIRRGIAPISLMWATGVSVGLSSNNVRNAFTPFGNADLMDVALFSAQTGHMGAPADFEQLIDTITYRNASIVGIAEGYGVSVGDRADLVVLDAPDQGTALLDRAVRSWVIKAGRVVSTTSITTTLTR